MEAVKASPVVPTINLDFAAPEATIESRLAVQGHPVP